MDWSLERRRGSAGGRCSCRTHLSLARFISIGPWETAGGRARLLHRPRAGRAVGAVPRAGERSSSRGSCDLRVRRRGRSDDPPRPHLLREHGAGLLPARRGGGGGHRRAHRLNRRLLAGEIDIAPISSIEYARNADAAAAASAAVRLLAGRGRLDPARLQAAARARAHGRRHAGERDVGRADEGAAAGSLARAARRGGGCEAPDRRRRAASPRSRIRRRTTISGGSGWSERACRWSSPSGPRSSRPPPGLRQLEAALVDSVRRARAEPEQLAHEASERYGYPPGFLARYFEKLRYSFGPRERAGLLTFLELARDVGELGHVPELRFVTEAGAMV